MPLKDLYWGLWVLGLKPMTFHMMPNLPGLQLPHLENDHMIPAAPFSMRFNDDITLASVDIPLGPMVILCKPQRSNGPKPLGYGGGKTVHYLQDFLDSEVVGFVKYATMKEIRNIRLGVKGCHSPLVVQGLRLCFWCRGLWLVPYQGTKIPQAAKRKKQTNHKKNKCQRTRRKNQKIKTLELYSQVARYSCRECPPSSSSPNSLYPCLHCPHPWGTSYPLETVQASQLDPWTQASPSSICPISWFWRTILHSRILWNISVTVVVKVLDILSFSIWGFMCFWWFENLLSMNLSVECSVVIRWLQS